MNGLRSKDPTVALCDHKLLTRSGCEWVKLALDPFHDYELPCVEGYPDLATGTSLVIRAQQSMTISAPAGVTGAWDAHVTAGPLDYALACDPLDPASHGDATWAGSWSSTGCSPGTLDTDHVGKWRNDGCRIECCPAGTATWSAAPTSATHTVTNIVLDQFLETNGDTEQIAYRVISSGFEVVNTSAPLEVGGAVSVYEYENSHAVTSTFFFTPPPRTPADVRVGVANVYRSPPQNLAAAKAFPTARTWAAKDGSYNVVKFSGPNTYSNVGKNDYVFASGTGLPRTSQASAEPGFGTTGAGAMVPQLGSVAHHTACTTTGAYYTGMPKGSTLQVTWRVALERIPSTADRTMQSLASPSAPYDAAALELYAQIARLLPPGVPQNYNDAGRWARMIYDKIREVAPAVFPVLQSIALATGNPAIAAGIGAVTPHIVQANEARKKAGAQARAQKPPPKFAVQNFGKPKGGRKGARAL